MTQQELGYIIKYIKAYYPKWDFDINDAFMLNVWYESFEEISFDGMQVILKQYCKTNTFPPQSPTDLLNLIPHLLPEEEAWELVLDCVNRNTSQEYFLKELYKTNLDVYKVAKDFAFYGEDILDTEGHKCIGYIAKHFKSAYRDFLKSFKLVKVSNLIIENKVNNQLIA